MEPSGHTVHRKLEFYTHFCGQILDRPVAIVFYYVVVVVDENVVVFDAAVVVVVVDVVVAAAPIKITTR